MVCINGVYLIGSRIHTQQARIAYSERKDSGRNRARDFTCQAWAKRAVVSPTV
jgi:hypothetical protein